MNSGSWTSSRARLLAGAAVITVVLCSVQAGVAAADDALVADLLKKLEKRDAVIFDLVKRVQQLEQRLGAAEAASAGSAAAPAGTASGAAAAGAAASGQTTRASASPQSSSPQPAAAPASPGTFAVDPEDAERALERSLVQAGALLLPFGTLDVEPGFTYVRQETTASYPITITDGLPIQEFLQVGTRENELSGSLGLRVGLPWTSQFEFSGSYAYKDRSRIFHIPGSDSVEEESTSASGFGDVTVGFAKELLRERGWRPDLIGRVRWSSDIGQEKDGLVLGSGSHSITGELTALKRQDPLAFFASGFYRTNFEKDDRDYGDEFGFILGTVLAASPDTSLSFSLQQTFADEVRENGRSIPGSDQVNSSLVVGASSVLGRGVLLSLNAGIGLTDDAPDYFVGVSLPIQFNLPIR